MRWILAVFLPLSLAACSPPPLPAAQSAKGVHDAAITLPAQGVRLKARLQASSRAVVNDGGWVDLRVFANDRECTKDRVVRQPPMGPNFSVTLNCETDVPAATPITFRAEQLERDATTSEVVIQANYVR